MLRSDPKTFWRVVNPHPGSALLCLGCGDTLLGESQLADQFNEFFSNVFTNDNVLLDTTISEMSVESNMEDIVISTYRVICAIDRLPTNSRPGPDSISAKLLKLTKYISGPLLERLFRQSLSMGELPDD